MKNKRTLINFSGLSAWLVYVCVYISFVDFKNYYNKKSSHGKNNQSLSLGGQ